jgi:acylphosphatase
VKPVPAAADPPPPWLVRIRGRVQGVGFRYACKQQARALGVVGWVRNRADGSVEALVDGAPDALARMRRWLAAGPPGAAVDSVEVSAAPAAERPPADFEQRPTA